MSDSGKDRWNSLLETLGVPSSEPTSSPVSEAPTEEAPAAPTKQQPISMLRPEKPKLAAKPKSAKPPAKSPSYWSRIAGALGLESSAAPEPITALPEPATPDEPAVESVESPIGQHEQPRPSRGQRDEESHQRSSDRPRREQRQRREEREEPTESDRQSLSEMFGKKEPDVNVFGLGIRDEDGETRTDVPDELSRRQADSGPVLDYDRPEGAELSFEQPASGERGFGDEEGEEREGRRRRRRRGRGRGRGRGGEREPQAAERHESDIEPAGEDADFDFDRDEELDLDTDLGKPPSAGRERGPRGSEEPLDFEGDVFAPRGGDEFAPRGGDEFAPRGGDEFAPRGGDEFAPRGGDEFAPRGGDEFAPRGERKPRRREERGEGNLDDDRRGGRARRGRGEREESVKRERDESRPPRGPRHATKVRSPADDEPDEDLHAAAMDDDEPGESGSPSHKKIPTWEEAVNMLIDANMASRANNPDRGDRGRGRGRGRGR